MEMEGFERFDGRVVKSYFRIVEMWIVRATFSVNFPYPCSV